MNPLFKALEGILRGLGSLDNSLNRRTKEAIKGGFFFIIFMLAVIGGIVGYRSGMQNAKIKSSPLHEFTNETFRIDINRERRGGNFSNILDSKLIHEMKQREAGKIPYPAREDMQPEYDRALVEPEAAMKYRAMPDTHESGSPLDPDYRGAHFDKRQRR
jgi:hypothetical protein